MTLKYMFRSDWELRKIIVLKYAANLVEPECRKLVFLAVPA